MKIFLPLIALATLLCSAHALVINPTFDSTITSNANAAEYEAGINAAIAQFEALFTDNVTINITFQATSDRSVFGENFANTQGTTFAQVQTALQTHATTATDASALSHITNDPTNGGSFFINYAEAKALGLRAANNSASDGTVIFGTNFRYTFDPNNRAVKGEYDFIGVIQHEISEVMGRTEGLNLDGEGYTVFDLFRYTAANAQTISSSATNVYFSVDGGVTKLMGFNSDPNDDLQDWATTSPYTSDSFNAVSNPNSANVISPADVSALDVIGYTPSATATRYGFATLTGTTNPNGKSTTAYFQYGFTTKYGNTTPVLNLGSGTTTLTVRYNISGLANGATYHYRLVVDSGGVITNGLDQTFTTPATPGPPAWHSAQVTGLTDPNTANMADGVRTGASHNIWNIYFYKGTDSNIWMVYLSNGQWSQQQLTTRANVSDWLTFMSGYGGALCYKGTDGNLWCVYYDSPSAKWINAQLGTLPQGVTMAGDIVVDNNAWFNIYYRGNDSHLYAAYWNGSIWAHVSLGGTATVKGNLSVDDTNHVIYYQGTDNNIGCFSWSGKVWQQIPLSTTGNVGGSVAVDTAGLLAYYKSSADNSAWCTYWTGKIWMPVQLDASANMSTSATSFSNIAPYAASYNTLYLDGNAQCDALYWDGSKWGHTLLGDGGWDLTGGLSLQAANKWAFTRRNDGNVVIFYYY